MRRVALVIAAAVLATAAATAYGGSAPPTKEPGRLLVGVDVPAPGFADGQISGSTIRNPRGFEIDLARAVGRRLGIPRVEFVYARFGGLFAAGEKPFDFAFEQITITPQRRRVVDFSAPYFDANQGVLIGRRVTPPRTLADLRGLQTCAQAATTGLTYVQSRLRPERRVRIYPSTAAALQAVQVGQCDAIVLDVPIVASAKKQRPSGYGIVAGQIITREQYGALFPKGSPLRPRVDAAIRALRANGTIGRLQARWFGLNFTKIRVLR